MIRWTKYYKPVFAHDGSAVASLGVSAPLERSTDDLIADVVAAARELSRALPASGP